MLTIFRGLADWTDTLVAANAEEPGSNVGARPKQWCDHREVCRSGRRSKKTGERGLTSIKHYEWIVKLRTKEMSRLRHGIICKPKVSA